MNHDVLELASLFTYIASNEDIEYERQRLEALHDQQIAVFTIEYPTLSGARCTRVTWEVRS